MLQIKNERQISCKITYVTINKSFPIIDWGIAKKQLEDLKAAAANREFLRRIGQMQLDDWKKRMTPDLLKKAGLSDADWQRYLKLAQDHDAAVRRLNAKLLQDALKKELRGGANPNAGLREVENSGVSGTPLDGNRGAPPPELRDPLRRLNKTDQ